MFPRGAPTGWTADQLATVSRIRSNYHSFTGRMLDMTDSNDVEAMRLNMQKRYDEQLERIHLDIQPLAKFCAAAGVVFMAVVMWLVIFSTPVAAALFALAGAAVGLTALVTYHGAMKMLVASRKEQLDEKFAREFMLG